MKPNTHYLLMAQYNQWMNQKLYKLCAEVPDDILKKDLGAFFKSIHGTFNHILCVDLMWMDRFDHEGELTSSLKIGVDLFDNFNDLTKARKKTDQVILKWAAVLNENWLQQSLSITSQAYKKKFTLPTWCFVEQFFNHQTHHRGQITTLLTQLGYDPGVTDIPLMPGLSEG